MTTQERTRYFNALNAMKHDRVSEFRTCLCLSSFSPSESTKLGCFRSTIYLLLTIQTKQ